jgi:hypothetical protein
MHFGASGDVLVIVKRLTIFPGAEPSLRGDLSMQLRVTCPACQTPLGVSAAHCDGTTLRCPRCRHEFALHVRPQSPPPTVAGRPPHDQLAQPRFSHNRPPQAPRVRPPANSIIIALIVAGSVLLLLALAGVVGNLQFMAQGRGIPADPVQRISYLIGMWLCPTTLFAFAVACATVAYVMATRRRGP